MDSLCATGADVIGKASSWLVQLQKPRGDLADRRQTGSNPAISGLPVSRLVYADPSRHSVWIEYAVTDERNGALTRALLRTESCNRI